MSCAATPERPRCRMSPARSTRAPSRSSGGSTRRSRIFAVVGAVAITLIITALVTPLVADTQYSGFDLGWRTGVAFLVGAACSMASGIIGMFVAVKANVRTASAARRSLVEAVQVAMRGGAVSGFLVVALSLLGVYLMFVAFGGLVQPGRRPVPDRRLRLRRLVRGPVRPARRRDLHQGRGRRVGPRGQGREGHPGGRPAQRRASSPTSSATTSATAPAAAPTCSNRPPPRTSGR